MTRLLPILLLCGCQSDTFMDASYLNGKDKQNPWQQAKEIQERKALADDQTKRVKHEAVMAHAHRHATNSIHLPVSHERQTP